MTPKAEDWEGKWRGYINVYMLNAATSFLWAETYQEHPPKPTVTPLCKHDSISEWKKG